MQKRIRLYPYKMYCESTKLLVDALQEKGINAMKVYPDRNYRPKPKDLVVNWGCSTNPTWINPLKYDFPILNHWKDIPNAINKIRSFARLKASNVSCPDVTVDAETARGWLNNGNVVVGRQSLTGRAGAGIVLMQTPQDFVVCPLYTVYKPKKKEFRIHVFKDSILDVQEKRKKKDFEGTTNSQIRTHGNGWVFCREDIVLPDDAAEQAIKAVRALGLDFGGIDLIWNQKENKSYVLEVNSAPGIEGTTVTKYADKLIEQLQAL